MDFKQISIKLIARLIRGFSSVAMKVLARFDFIPRIFVYLGKGLFKILIFPVYRLFYVIKYKIFNVYAPAKSKVFYFLNKSYLAHLLIIIIGFGVMINGLSAEELRAEGFGEQTIIYSVVSKEILEELTEEYQSSFSADKILSYLDNTASVESQKGMVDFDADSPGDMITEFSSLTEGVAAVVKPNIIEPIKHGSIGPAPTANKGVLVYLVQPGETISAIAEKFKISVETILWQNNLNAKSVIKAGNQLEILSVTGVMHKVKSGENIGSIAKKYKVEQEKIISANNLFDVNDIKIGQKVIIPGGKLIVPYVSKPNLAQKNVPTVSPISKLFLPPTQGILSSGMLWPTSVRIITQYFSWRHMGLDIAGPKGTPLYASDDGEVVLSGWSTGYGYNILIDHGNGRRTRYAHNSKLYVEKGDQVVKGQTIAAMGSTGWSTGSHIHFEVIVGGVKKNPLAYVK